MTMLELLSNARKYSIDELSKILEVSKRMIRTYKEDLEKAGIYIDTLKGKYGGYILNQDIKIVTAGFSKYDVELLKNIYDNNLIQKDLKKELLSLINKVEYIYKGSKKKSEEYFDTNSIKDKYNIFSKCIKNKTKINIDYLSVSGNIQKRTIHPYHLIYYGDDWRVSAFCELRNDFRHFSFERIKSIKELNENFE
jgi:predicted DNA-binding transcriptional regulator YafY